MKEERMQAMTLSLGRLTIECVIGDIVAQPDMDAVVNAANAQLRPGGGVAGAIHAAAGPDLARACAPLAPIEPGEAVMTEGFALPNPFVVHCLGPVYGRDRPEAALLARAHARALALADAQGLHGLAFPALSAGAFGYPLREAAPVAVGAVAQAAPALASLRLVRFVLRDEASFDAFAESLARLNPQ